MSSRPWAVGAAVAASVTAGYGVLVRPCQLSWHATSQEAQARIDGADVLPCSDLTATRAISIRASADRVWPWLAQLGQEHGGFYSYAALEDLVGCHIRSARRIIPGWQDISAGDQVQLTPKVRLGVAMVAPGRAIVLQGGVPPARPVAPVRLHLGVRPDRAARRDDAPGGARAIPVHAALGTATNRAPRGGELPDDPADAARDPRPREQDARSADRA
ncbi:MAG: hypothetical protein M3Y33_08715 [Actinomycetota bacterium]|nr:hypothetical protein [Actinomycetota bacterium]